MRILHVARPSPPRLRLRPNRNANLPEVRNISALRSRLSRRAYALTEVEGQAAMRIGEVAQSARVSTSRIRFYEEEGLLPAAERAANGYRVYTKRTVKIVSFIERAQRLGFSLREISEFLKSPARLNPSRENLLPVLETKLRAMDKHLREARQRRKELKAFIDDIESGVSPTIGPVPATERTNM